MLGNIEQYLFFCAQCFKVLINSVSAKNKKGVTKNRKERKDLLMQSQISEILGTCQQPHVGFGEI